jgi:hypothetical protein
MEEPGCGQDPQDLYFRYIREASHLTKKGCRYG